MIRKVEIPAALISRLDEQARSAHPQECCGILLGEGGLITGIKPTTNVHPAPETHFEIDPQVLINAHRAARDGGPQVLGYYHSHPTGPPRPSPTDRAMASGDGRIWAIAGEGGIKFWHDLPEGFAPLSHQIIET